MIGIATSLTIFQTSIIGGTFGILYAAGLSPRMVIGLFAFVGLGRMASLYANGRWHPFGPWIRFVGCTLGAVMWAVMFSSLLQVYLTTGVAYAAALAVYLIMAVAELDAGSRAVHDARRSVSAQ